MGYKELINELALENSIMAIKRVNKDEYKLKDLPGCIFKWIDRILGGETYVFAEGSLSCGGFSHNTGLRDDPPIIPGGFGKFLSEGSTAQWTPPGERLKCDPETAYAFYDSLPKDVMGGYDALKFSPYQEGCDADVVVCFVNSEQLSVLMNLHGYDRGSYCNVIGTMASGCASMVRIPLAQLKEEESKAVITCTDLAMRKYHDENRIAIAFTGPDFEKMCTFTETCFFHSPVFAPTRKRLHKDMPDKPRFSRIAE